MSDLYDDLHTAIETILRADAGIAAEVRTVEAGVRECLFTGDKLSKGFRVSDNYFQRPILTLSG